MSSESLDGEQIRLGFRAIAATMKSRSEQLRELDAACGDGDLGITVTKGFAAIEERLADLQGEPPPRLLQALGITFNNAAASTFGVFFTTAFMHAGKSIEKRDRIEVEDLGPMLRSAADGIMVRGRANVGDKTILDALVPASEAAQATIVRGGGWTDVLEAAAAAARRGAEGTKELLPKAGRARWLGEQARGSQDPGATFVQFFLEACLDAFRTTEEGR